MRGNQQPTMGDNRTGTARAKERCEEMLRGNPEFAPQPALEEESDGAIAEVRRAYAGEAEPIGSVPPPASAKQVGKAAAAKVKGASPSVLVDKLGARLAFERSGVRLYEALLSKFDVFGTFDGGPTRSELETIHEQEHKHFIMLKNAIEKLGGDPTAVTPSADVEATLSMGVQAVMVDPRIDCGQALEAALVAELVDNDGWDGLIEVVTEAGEDELAVQFELARQEEREHLASARRWLSALRLA
jgi:rubrerythrin